MRLPATVLAITAGLAALGCGKMKPGVSAGTGGVGTSGAGGDVGTGGSGAGGTDTDASVADGSAVDAPGPTFDGPPTPPFLGSYHMGADITWIQHDENYGASYVDTDGTTKEILTLLKNHGFNSIRMRTYVDPQANDGYDKFGGFGDKAHTVRMGSRIKDAGMGFYLAIHYSDNWADPGKQCIPQAWQGVASLDELAAHVHDYTFDLISALQAVGATPDLVQVGNEITSGMLIHICDVNGLPTSVNPINGSIASWPNLAQLLKAGIAAVKEVDPRIKTVLHIDRAGDLGSSVAFIQNALAQNVPFDVFANSAYVYWHGQPSGWQNTFSTLVTMFPNLSFAIPEYGNETATDPLLPSTIPFVNDLVYNMPDKRGVGAWIYEPEHPFQAGPSPGISLGIGLFDGAHDDAGVETQDSWPIFPALPGAFGLYDTMKTTYAGRL